MKFLTTRPKEAKIYFSYLITNKNNKKQKIFFEYIIVVIFIGKYLLQNGQFSNCHSTLNPF